MVDGYMSIDDTVSSPSFTATPLSYSVTGNSTFMGESVHLNVSVMFLPIDTSVLTIVVPSEYSIGTLNVFSPQAAVGLSQSGSSLNLTLTKIVGPNVTIHL